MDLILSSALAAGRRVRRETVLGRHPSSVSSSAVGLIADRWGSIGARSVVVLGAGEAAEGVLRALYERGATAITLLSRHPERTRALAEAWGAALGDLDRLDQAMEGADLLIVAAASARPIVTTASLGRALSGRPDRKLLVVDLGIPRNVEPAARRLEWVELFDLDDLQRLCCPAAGTASAALLEAERLIEDELERLSLGLRGRIVAPRLAELHRLGLEMAEEESDWALGQLESLSEPQREVVREMADRLVRRVLYPVSRTLRAE
jgi:glutamyl-tRNA reductase